LTAMQGRSSTHVKLLVERSPGPRTLDGEETVRVIGFRHPPRVLPYTPTPRQGVFRSIHTAFSSGKLVLKV